MAERLTNGRKVFHKEKAIVILLILIFAVTIFLIPLESAEASNRCSAIVVTDATSGEVLYAQNPDVKMEIASTTKILTAITVIENADVFMRFSIPREAVGVEGSSIYLREGERWRVLDLLYGLMLRSGNDAATALAIATAGNVESFAELMNVTAKKIGVENSKFTNPHGLHDESHYSTARDMAVITSYALNCPIFAKICATKSYRCEKQVADQVESVTFYNKNKILYSYQGAIGVKTGYTKHSGRCLVSAAKRGERVLVCVVLNYSDTYGVTKSLFDKYFALQENKEQNSCEKGENTVS